MNSLGSAALMLLLFSTFWKYHSVEAEVLDDSVGGQLLRMLLVHSSRAECPTALLEAPDGPTSSNCSTNEDCGQHKLCCRVPGSANFACWQYKATKWVYPAPKTASKRSRANPTEKKGKTKSKSKGRP